MHVFYTMSLGCIVIHRLQYLLANARNFVHETAGIRWGANAHRYCEKLWQVQSQVRNLYSIFTLRFSYTSWPSSMSIVRFHKPIPYICGVYRRKFISCPCGHSWLPIYHYVPLSVSFRPSFSTHEKIKRIWISTMKLGNKKEEEIFIVFVVLVASCSSLTVHSDGAATEHDDHLQNQIDLRQ